MTDQDWVLYRVGGEVTAYKSEDELMAATAVSDRLYIDRRRQMAVDIGELEGTGYPVWHVVQPEGTVTFTELDRAVSFMKDHPAALLCVSELTQEAYKTLCSW